MRLGVPTMEEDVRSGRFELDRGSLLETGRVHLGPWTDAMLSDLSEGIDGLARETGFAPVQRGRVVVLRQTDVQRRFSSFKAALYHGNYHDMDNGERLLKEILPRHHSTESLRGESILFLFVGVSKTVYDALTTHCAGRQARICGGSRHTVPWGIEVPVKAANAPAFAERNMTRVERANALFEKRRQGAQVAGELEEAYQELPVCYLMPPFLLEFSEEALVKNVFRQRLWEPGAQYRDYYPVVRDMWSCCMALDAEKFEALRRDLGSSRV